MDYDILGDGYGVNPEGDGVRWIFWAPGCKIKEGFIPWDELGVRSHYYIPGWILLSQAAMIAMGELPRFPAQAIIVEVRAWFVGHAEKGQKWKTLAFSTKQEAKKYLDLLGLPLTPTELPANFDYSRYASAILPILKSKAFPPKTKEQEVREFICSTLSKEQLRQIQCFVGAGGCSRSYPLSACHAWRHRATTYDRDLRAGADILTATIDTMTQFVEVLQFYKHNQEYILSATDCKTDSLRHHQKMAQLDHDALIAASFKQIANKRQKQEAQEALVSC